MTAIETRLDLARHLQEQMAASRSVWAVTDEEESREKTMLKTYLLEAHPHRIGKGIFQALVETGRSLGFTVHSGSDVDLFRLTHPEGDFWCDSSRGRFWRLHTTVPVVAADAFRAKLVAGTRWLDQVWFPGTYLESLVGRIGAKMLAFAVNHDRRTLNPKGVLGSDTDYVSLRLFASHPEATLRRLKQSDAFPRGISVRSVRFRSESASVPEEYCIAEYFHHGKITVNGTSFDEHNRIVVRALDDYEKFVGSIETKYGLGTVTDGDGCSTIVGDPVVIDVAWEVADLDYAISRMFTGRDPFRLWGIPRRVAAKHYRARATDLHFGGVLTFDMTPSRMIIQMPRDVCGNTIARLLSHLRMHVSADAKLVESAEVGVQASATP